MSFDGIDVVGWEEMPGPKKFVRGSHVWYHIDDSDPAAPQCPCPGFNWRKRCSHIDKFKRGEYVVEMQFKITFKKGPEIVAEIPGIVQLNSDDLTVQEAAEKVLRTEAFLEKLLGLRVHIEQVL